MPDYAVYGVHFYGTALYGLPPTFEFTLNYFEANPVGYDRIKVEWGHPSGDWDRLRLVRGTYGFPTEYDDGKLMGEWVVDATVSAATGLPVNPGTYEDTAVAELKFYYYTLWLRMSLTGDWRRAGNVMALMPKNFMYTERLYELTPGVFRDQDIFVLPTSGQGALQTFLGVFGYELDQMRSEIESLRWVSQPHKMSGGLLPYLASQLGFPYEAELGMGLVRKQLLNAVYLYKLKGTRMGAEGAVSVLTGWSPVTVAESPGAITFKLLAERVNLAMNPSFEADASWWEVEANTDAPARVDPGAANRLYGTYVGTLTATAAGDASWRTPGGTGGMPVTPGRLYTASLSFRAVTAARDTQLFINWFDAAGAYISTVTGTVVPDSTTAWVRPSVQDVAPANAAYGQVVPKVLAAGAGEVHWVEGLLFEAGDLGPFFDGTTTPIADHLWEGTAHLSRSHRYYRRAVKNSRLVTRLPEFLPAGTTVTFLYAEPL